MVNGGLDFKRFDQVLAVLIKHGKVKLYNQDARVNVLGGAPACEPATDAAMAAAILSSFHEVNLPPDIVFVGEVDLGGAAPLATRRDTLVPARGRPGGIPRLPSQGARARCAGELRAVRALEKRVATAVQLGFRKVVAPRGSAAVLPQHLRAHVVECGTVRQLKSLLLAKGKLRENA